MTAVRFPPAARALGHVQLARPLAWIWFDFLPSFAIAGLVVSGGVPFGTYALLLLLLIAADSAGSTVNDICDQATDAASSEASRQRRPLLTGAVGRGAAALQAVLLFAVALALAGWLGRSVLLVLLVGVVFEVGYSAPPLRLSGRPWANHILSTLIWSGILWLIAIACSPDAAREPERALALAGEILGRIDLLFFGLGLVLFVAWAEMLAKDLRDLENDRATGKRTTAVHLGARRTARLIPIFSALGSLCWCIGLFLHASFPPAMIVLVGGVAAVWQTITLRLCIRLRSVPDQGDAQRLHQGFIWTFALLSALTGLGQMFGTTQGLR